MSVQIPAVLLAPAHADADHELAAAIRRAIAYAALFGQAISAAEIVRYLDTRADTQDLQRVLARYTHHLWHERDGDYALPSADNIFAQTKTRRCHAMRQWARAQHWAAWMARLPFVRMIGVTGSLAMHNMQPDADMDYFVVVARGRVWLTRLLLIAVVRVARLCGDELCPNYVLGASALHLSDQSYFTARELAQMVPLFGLDVYRQLRLLNAWSLRYLPASGGAPAAPSEIRLGRGTQRLKTLMEKVLSAPFADRIEAWEMRRKIARLRRLPGADSPNVVLNAEQCKGHFGGTHRALAEQMETR